MSVCDVDKMEKGITRIPIEDSIVYSDVEEFDSNESEMDMLSESDAEEEEEEENEEEEEETSPVDYGVDLSAFE